LAAAVRFLPTIRLKSCFCSLFFVLSSLNPFKGTVAFEHVGNSRVIRIGSKSCLSHRHLSQSSRQQCCDAGYFLTPFIIARSLSALRAHVVFNGDPSPIPRFQRMKT
jgi:hypothetical protein